MRTLTPVLELKQQAKSFLNRRTQCMEMYQAITQISQTQQLNPEVVNKVLDEIIGYTQTFTLPAIFAIDQDLSPIAEAYRLIHEQPKLLELCRYKSPSDVTSSILEQTLNEILVTIDLAKLNNLTAHPSNKI